MIETATIGRLDHLTFKGNHKRTRYGWLRLTPAYSIHLVADLLDKHAKHDAVVLDPFCGTGTTALACAERGIACDTTDINPFLVWLAHVKTRAYEAHCADALLDAGNQVRDIARADTEVNHWIPPLHQIEKWWDTSTLSALARIMAAIAEVTKSVSLEISDLLKLAFCMTMIKRANVSFGHQSMSFRSTERPPMLPGLEAEEDLVISTWTESVNIIASGVHSQVMQEPNVVLCDARALSGLISDERYTCVITSPPYPNRMSYIRELRPYMYWLGYLRDGRAAGELDWQAIGGTWGCATSNIGKWRAETCQEIAFDGFRLILEGIEQHSPLLSRYVHKYFYDMTRHVQAVFNVVRPGGIVNYIVGNSKFYDVLVPVEAIYARLFEAAGFEQVDVQAIRKRSYKKELLEYVVSACKPATSMTTPCSTMRGATSGRGWGASGDRR